MIACLRFVLLVSMFAGGMMVEKHDLQITTKELRDTSGHHHTSDNQVGKTTTSKK